MAPADVLTFTNDSRMDHSLCIVVVKTTCRSLASFHASTVPMAPPVASSSKFTVVVVPHAAFEPFGAFHAHALAAHEDIPARHAQGTVPA